MCKRQQATATPSQVQVAAIVFTMQTPADLPVFCVLHPLWIITPLCVLHILLIYISCVTHPLWIDYVTERLS